MPSLAEVIARAEEIAVGRGNDPHQSPVLDNGMTAEALYPHAVRYAILRDLRQGGGTSQDYNRTYTITVASGSGALPDTVMREFFDNSYLPNEPYSAFVPYPDYSRMVTRIDTILTYYSIDGDTFYCTEDGNIDLVVPGMPDAPVDADTDLGLTAKLTEDVIIFIADALTNRLSLSELIRP